MDHSRVDMEELQIEYLTELRCLSVRQPFADMIIYGDKWCENRTWVTEYRGPLFIHASRWSPGWTAADQREWIEDDEDFGIIQAVIGYVELVDIVAVEDLHARNVSEPVRRVVQQHDDESWQHVEGPLCWILDGAQAIEPIESTGALYVWTLALD